MDVSPKDLSTFVGISTQESTLFTRQISNAGVSTFFNTVNVKTAGGSVIQDASGTLDIKSNIISLENNAGVLMKIAVTVFGLVSLYQFNIALSWVRFNFESAAHSLAVLKESGVDISARAESFINNANGSTDVPVFNITPDLIGILFLLSVGYLIVGRLWLGHK